MYSQLVRGDVAEEIEVILDWLERPADSSQVCKTCAKRGVYMKRDVQKRRMYTQRDLYHTIVKVILIWLERPTDSSQVCIF